MSRERKAAFCSRSGLPRMSREWNGVFCSREGLPRLPRERDGAFCSRKGLPRLPRERNGAICSREGLPRLSRERDGAFCSQRVCQGCLVSETARSAHERVCRCASGRRRVCVVTEESRHPYLRNSALHHRATKWYESVAQACLAALSGDDKCQKRCPGVSSWSGARNVGTLFHRHRDDGCPGVSSWSGARKDSGTIKGA